MGDLIIEGIEAVFWVVFAPIWIPLALLGRVVKFVKDRRRRLRQYLNPVALPAPVLGWPQSERVAETLPEAPQPPELAAKNTAKLKQARATLREAAQAASAALEAKQEATKPSPYKDVVAILKDMGPPG